MYSKFIGKGKNNGTAENIVNYIGKEGEKSEKIFFNHRGYYTESEVKKMMKNSARLQKKDDKFFHLIVAPSKIELQKMDDDQFQKYCFLVMNNYSESFGKGYTKDDFEYAVCIHHDRDYNGMERKWQKPEQKKTYKERIQKKEGDQRHAHFIIRRNLRTEDGKEKKIRSASPLSNYKNINQDAKILQGFNRNEFKKKNEKTFDLMFGYERPVEDTYEYARDKWFEFNQEKLQIQKQTHIDAKKAHETGFYIEEIVDISNQMKPQKEKSFNEKQKELLMKIKLLQDNLFNYVIEYMSNNYIPNPSQVDSYDLTFELIENAFIENPNWDKKDFIFDFEFNTKVNEYIKDKLEEKNNFQDLGR